MTEPADEVSVVYDAADIRSLYGACRRCRRNLILLSFAPLAFLLLDVLDGKRGVALIPSAVSYFIIGVVIAIAFYVVVPRVQIWSRSRSAWSSPLAVSLTDEGIVTRHANQDSRFHWAAIKDVVERGGRLFLFTTPSCAIILPRRVFDSDAQFQRWSDEARSYWRAAAGTEHQ